MPQAIDQKRSLLGSVFFVRSLEFAVFSFATMPPMVDAGSVERLCENHKRKDMVSVEEAAVQFSLADKTL